MSGHIASTERVEVKHPDTGEWTEAWLCMCGCPPHAEGMCLLQSNEEDGHISPGELIYAHLSCVAPRMEPMPS